MAKLLSSSDIATVFLDLELHVKLFTPAAMRLLNLIATDIGRPIGDFSRNLTENLVDQVPRVIDKLMPVEEEKWAEGELCYLRRILPYRTQDKRIEGVVVTFLDITYRKLAERSLAESEQKYRSLFEDSRDAIYLSSREGKVLDVNQASLDLFGYTKKEMIGMPVRRLYVNPRDRAEFQKVIEQEGFVTDYEVKFRKKDTTEITCLLTSSLRRSGDGSILGYQGIFRDITERKRTESRLLDYQERLRSLTGQLALSGHADRQRIAGELHDTVCQPLVLVKMGLTELKESVGSSVAEALDRECEILDETIGNVRSSTFDLSPPELEELGLGAALDSLCKRLEERHGISIEFEEDHLQKPFGKSLSVILFQAVRELLTNVVKHANAQQVKVTILKKGGGVEIRVEDDGVGFDSSVPIEGFGLFHIREQLRDVGGHMTIESEPGHGVRATLILVIPLEDGGKSELR